MIKIPSLYLRDFEGDSSRVLRRMNPECIWVSTDKANTIATRKWDGAAMMVKDGHLYKRYDAKHGKMPPEGAMPCIPEPDPQTGHWPHWVQVDADKAADIWMWQAFLRADGPSLFGNGTFELCGPHFQGNPEHLEEDTFIRHGADVIPHCPIQYDELAYMFRFEHTDIEGVVWHHKLDGRMCKIKRSDFGLERVHEVAG
jgi:hypothetical protein